MTRFQRASQIWPMLVWAAQGRKIYIYREVAEVLGMPRAWRQIGKFLHPIMLYCRENDLPPLTVLVVNKATSIPGVGLTTAGELTLERVKMEQERVFGHDWSRSAPPTPEEFARTESNSV